MKRILVVAAHPDDEVLGCGGTVARFCVEGAQVRFVICGEGVTSRPGADVSALADLDVDLRRAAEKLGVTDVFHLDFPDNRFDNRDLLDLVRVVEQNGLSFDPDVVFTHHRGDLNVDHRYVHDAVMAAFRPLPGRKPVAIYAMEVASSTGWQGPSPERAFAPTVFFDIAETLETKIAAMQTYRGEKKAWPHPRSPEALRAAAQYWGSRAGLAAAEPFVLLRDIR
jgi:LmbE family N-acetylglucosaminyl deacetylase